MLFIRSSFHFTLMNPSSARFWFLRLAFTPPRTYFTIMYNHFIPYFWWLRARILILISSDSNTNSNWHSKHLNNITDIPSVQQLNRLRNCSFLDPLRCASIVLQKYSRISNQLISQISHWVQNLLTTISLSRFLIR